MLPAANGNGYILVNANGGLNQMRDGVSNYLNLNAIFRLYLKCPNLILGGCMFRVQTIIAVQTVAAYVPYIHVRLLLCSYPPVGLLLCSFSPILGSP